MKPDQRSAAAIAYRAWYRTADWFRLRAQCLKRDPYCVMCLRAGRRTPSTTADHVRPHRGDRSLFLSLANLQGLCDAHHTDKQRIENGGAERVPIGADGWPMGL